MAEWKEDIIGSYIQLINGYAFKSKDFLDVELNGALPVVKIKNVANGDVNLNNVQYHNFHSSLKKYLIEENDVLIAMTGNHPQAKTQVVGDVSKYKLKDKALLNQRVGKIVAESNTNLSFIYYFFKDEATHQYLASQSSGSANQANISKDDILNIPVLLPPLPEQEAIAEVLSSLDDKIDLLHRQNKTLESMAEALFRQWFVEEAQEDWEEVTLGEVVNIYDSKRIPLSSLEREKMKDGYLYPYYGAATIMDYVNEYIFDGEYILMGEDGTVETDEGYPVLQLPVGKFWVNNHAHVLEAKSPYSNFLIYIFLKSTNITNIITGAVQPKINQEALKGIPFLKPSINIITSTVKNFESYWQKIKANQSQIRTLTQLRDTLLPKLMSGEVRVK